MRLVYLCKYTNINVPLNISMNMISFSDIVLAEREQKMIFFFLQYFFSKCSLLVVL